MRRTKPKAVKTFVKSGLGPLEEQVVRAICSAGRVTVRDIVLCLQGRFAYTTVMSTMDRLYRKGLLRRETHRKAYIYYPVMTLLQLETQVAHDLITAFLIFGQGNTDLLAIALVDAISAQDASLLDEVEEEIRIRRLNYPIDAVRAAQPLAGSCDWPLGRS